MDDIRLCRVCGIEFAADDRHNCLGDPSQKTQDRIKLKARILALWEPGLMSGAQIGAEVGLSRNAVLGAIHRARRSGKAVRSRLKARPKPEPQKGHRRPLKRPTGDCAPNPRQRPRLQSQDASKCPALIPTCIRSYI